MKYKKDSSKVYMASGSAAKYSMDRRSFLRGSLLSNMAVAIGLPTLDIMLNENGNAYADSSPLPKRFGVFYWGGGIHYKSWVPSATGYNWNLPEALSDFAGLKDYITLLTKFNHPGSSPGHIPARGIALSASHDLNRNIAGVGTYRGQKHPEPSVDNIVAEAWKGQTTFDQLGISICRRGPYKGNSSWGRGGAKKHQEPSPQKFFDRIFTGKVKNNSNASLIANTAAAQKSMLDAVMADTQALKRKVGAVDSIRLEQHLEGLRKLELSLQNPIGACSTPARPAQNNFGDGGTKEQKEAKSKLMSDLLAVALSCDLTRVFSYEFSATQSEAVYWEVGVNKAHHDVTHEAGQLDPNKKIIKFIMKNFAYLARKLSETPEGAGNLLDNSLIFGTSEHANAGGHNYKNHPLIFVGRAGVKSGQHLSAAQVSGKDYAARALLTAVQAMDVPLNQVGQSAHSRVASNAISEILKP